MPVITWLLAQFVMTGVLPMPAEAAAAGAVPLCTPTGIELVVLDTGGPAPANTADRGDCPWCQAFGAMPELAPPAEAVPVALDGKTLKFRLVAATTLARLGARAFQSRAPPL